MAPHSDKMKLMRVVVREDFTKSRCDALIADFKLALETLDAMDTKRLQQQKEYVDLRYPTVPSEANFCFRHVAEFLMRRRSTLLGSLPPKRQATAHFTDDHSLQGQHGKTHGVC